MIRYILPQWWRWRLIEWLAGGDAIAIDLDLVQDDHGNWAVNANGPCYFSRVSMRIDEKGLFIDGSRTRIYRDA